MKWIIALTALTGGSFVCLALIAAELFRRRRLDVRRNRLLAQLLQRLAPGDADNAAAAAPDVSKAADNVENPADGEGIEGAAAGDNSPCPPPADKVVSGPPMVSLVEDSGEPAERYAGEVKLNGVPDRVAVQLMAIVASELDVPLSQLSFISIRDVTG